MNDAQRATLNEAADQAQHRAELARIRALGAEQEAATYRDQERSALLQMAVLREGAQE